MTLPSQAGDKVKKTGCLIVNYWSKLERAWENLPPMKDSKSYAQRMVFMFRHFDSELSGLKEKILAMGGLVERSIEEATQAIFKREPERFEFVRSFEERINEHHVLIDEECLELLARKAPLAQDLRLILAVVKINTDLERMGDQAINISHNGREYLAKPPVRPLTDFSEMAREVREMVRNSLDAFVKQDLTLAQRVLERDDVVDRFKNTIFQELTSYMRIHPQDIEVCLNLILIARNLERLADHATNIAEDVIFVRTGRDVRHGHRVTGT